jgi:hypothetical protein
MSRMVGGTFGVAVMGALVSALGHNRIDQLLPQASQASRDKLAEGLGIGASTQAPGRTGDVAREAFVYALNNGLRLAALIALVGAAVAWWLIVPKPAPEAETEVAPVEAMAELAG